MVAWGMSLFLLFSPLIAFFFLRATVFSNISAASLRIFLRGVLLSAAILLLYWLSRTLLPRPIEGILGVFYYWYYGWAIWLAPATIVFALAPSWMQGPGRRDRLIAFMLGALSTSGLANILHVDQLRDPYWVLILPLFRIGLVCVLLPLLDDLVDESGGRLALMIGAALLVSLIPALFPVFHFWKAWYLSLPWLIGCLAAGAYFAKDLFLEPLSDEWRALRRGL